MAGSLSQLDVILANQRAILAQGRAILAQGVLTMSALTDQLDALEANTKAIDDAVVHCGQPILGEFE